jgi:hypothetical protein
MNTNQFPTEAERQEAIAILRGLIEMPYWKFLVEKIIEPKIKEIEGIILDGEYEGDVRELKMERKSLKYLIEIPKIKMIELSQLASTDELDPYQKETKPLTKMTR